MNPVDCFLARFLASIFFLFLISIAIDVARIARRMDEIAKALPLAQYRIDARGAGDPEVVAAAVAATVASAQRVPGS